MVGDLPPVGEQAPHHPLLRPPGLVPGHGVTAALTAETIARSWLFSAVRVATALRSRLFEETVHG